MRFRRDKMKYLCMVVFDEKKLEAMSESAIRKP